jgi:restriction system protein
MTYKKNEKSKPDLINPHGGYRNLKSYQTYIESSLPEVAANTLICLIHQANYLLDQQLRQLGKQFLEEGGFTEKLYQARQQVKRK